MSNAKPAPEGGRTRRPGSTDVAKLAGVSQKTVSRVLNDEPYVKEEVRLRVLAAVRELGYRRNESARALNSGRTRRIGVVSLGTALFGPSTQLVSIERALRSTGYSMSVVNTFEGDAGGVAGAVDHLLEQGVDGIILSEPIDEGAGKPIKLDIPVLSFGDFPGLSARPILITGGDNVTAGRAATEHLLELGHRTVWHIAGPQRWWAARDRLEGWRQALAAAGAQEPPLLEGDWSPASGYQAGRELAANDEVTAIFAANDDMAIGVLRALTEAGRTVPGDVSIVGFDDIPAAEYLNPPLTTIPQNFDQYVERGIAKLVKEIEEPTGDRSPTPEPPSLRPIIRQSTATPRTPARP
ncbi:DNA-binding LacI/PurR family transcriptional regulator [Kribbella sp. VKM Ac-2527]|uniref:DNA-binding LacI/PurR family transcriptional regulator n=1 Tax=Kribbella caucasensis TaxID=2512215 RepID=A0A4R6KCK1_9ACTN|nr:LacI family DNA-binding transcriptional regulator [Kribbella sp. VKM Ac-2527]TDO47329.1 DNA-binding LacI/PurR family transcriptional regulator [Kribbella sp. VKM Ac-2527]